MRMLDLFAGRLGWTKAFLARGWECVAVDLVRPSELPKGVEFICQDILAIGRGWDSQKWMQGFDFICASSPCEEFSKFGMPCFFPNPPHPGIGIKLFNHSRQLCEESGVPFVLENVRAAQRFVGDAVNHCGAFHLWGTGVPLLLPQGIVKGFTHGAVRAKGWGHDKRGAAAAATIPTELANCVADYAEAICRQRQAV